MFCDFVICAHAGLDAHGPGYNVSHAATRLLTMTKPVYQAIMRHSPRKPVIVFTPTRKQARITAVDLVTARCVMDLSWFLVDVHGPVLAIDTTTCDQ